MRFSVSTAHLRNGLNRSHPALEANTRTADLRFSPRETPQRCSTRAAWIIVLNSRTAVTAVTQYTICFWESFMRLDYTSLSHCLGKLALAAVLGVGAAAGPLSSTPAQAQMPKIVVQCVAPLVPNSDGTDCVRPATRAKTCPRPTILYQGRCREPIQYIRYSGCDSRTRAEYGVSESFDLGFYPGGNAMVWNYGSNTGIPKSYGAAKIYKPARRYQSV